MVWAFNILFCYLKTFGNERNIKKTTIDKVSSVLSVTFPVRKIFKDALKSWSRTEITLIIIEIMPVKWISENLNFIVCKPIME